MYSKDVQPMANYQPFDRPAVEPYSTELKVLTYSVNNNTIHLRVANLDDPYDGPAQPKFFDVQKFAINYYNQATTMFGHGGTINASDIKIGETTLTGVLDYQLATKAFREFEWKHEPEVTLKLQKMRRSGEKIEFPDEKTLKVQPRDPEPGRVLAFEPQRIRSFIITYNYRSLRKDKRIMQLSDGRDVAEDYHMAKHVSEEELEKEVKQHVHNEKGEHMGAPHHERHQRADPRDHPLREPPQVEEDSDQLVSEAPPI